MTWTIGEIYESAWPDRRTKAYDCPEATGKADRIGVFDTILAGITTVGAVVAPGLPLVSLGPLITAVAGVSEGAAKDGLPGALAAVGYKPAATSSWRKNA